jgi:hypothetical protein
MPCGQSVFSYPTVALESNPLTNLFGAMVNHEMKPKP